MNESLDTQKTIQVTIPAENLKEVHKHINLFLSRCGRKGLPKPQFIESKPYFQADHEVDGWYHNLPKPQIEVVDITLISPRVALEGWSLLGRVDRLPDGSPLVARTPGTESIILPDIADPLECQYCKKRRVRIETFLVSHYDGRTCQVGRNCLRDFLGHDPALLLWWYRTLDELKTASSGWGLYTPAIGRIYPTELILNLTARVAAHGGFLSRSKAHEINDNNAAKDIPRHVVATADKVAWRLEPRNYYRTERPRWYGEVSVWDSNYPEDAASNELLDLTHQALEKLHTQGPTSEWESNVSAVTEQGFMRPLHLGTGVSAIILGLRAQERVKQQKTLPPSKHFGTIGERITVPVTVSFMRQIEEENAWGGTSYLIKFRHAEGDFFWFASRLPTHKGVPDPTYPASELPLALGDEIILKGTVMAHEEDRYTHLPITKLSRCVVEATVSTSKTK